MKKTKKIEPETGRVIKLGIFVIAMIVVLIIGVFWVGSKKNIFESTFYIHASFNDVSGLQAGDNVRFRGLNVGTVKEISVLNDSTVMVSMIIKNKMKPFIRKSAKATIVTDGLLGNKMVNIRNGHELKGSVSEHDTIKATEPIDQEDALRKLKTSNDRLSEITSNLSAITGKMNSGKGTVGELINDSALAKDVKQSVKTIKTDATTINKETEALKHNILFRKYFKKEEKKNKP